MWPFTNLGADSAEHIIITHRRDRQGAKARHPKVAGTHTDHAPAGVTDFIQLEWFWGDTAELVQGHAEVDRKPLVGEGMDGDGLVVDLTQPVMQATNI